MYSFGLSAYEDGDTRRASGGTGAGSSDPYQFYQSTSRSTRTSPAPAPAPAPTPASAAATRATTNTAYHYVVDLGDEHIEIGEPNLNSMLSPTLLTTLLAGFQPRMRTNTQVDELSAVANLLLRLSGATPNRLEPVIVRPTAEQIAEATEIARTQTEQDCAICQDTISVTQDCRKILHCGHWFHKDCIDPWFQQNVQCPICRYDIREYRANAEDTTPSRQSFPEEDLH